MDVDRIRVFVTPPSGHKAIPERASADLGFNIELSVYPTEQLVALAMARPESFDLIQVEYWMINKLGQKGSIQPVAAAEIERFPQVSTLFTHGVIGNVDVSQIGGAPHTMQFAGAGRDQASAWLNAVPTICNSDTLGWRQDRVAHSVESWGDLLSESYRGRVALADVPAVSYLEASLACQARGLVHYRDIGEQSRQEIDATYRVLLQLADQGHFNGLWASFETSVECMTGGPVAIQSLWPPAVTALKKQSIPVRYGPLREGYRGWAGGLAMSSAIAPDRRRHAIAYMNWYISGWAGAYLMRQGYYCSTPDAARSFLSADEWGYWQLGLPAKGSIAAPDGSTIGKPDEAREGGSFEDRMSRIACWSSCMAEDDYLRRGWAAFRERVAAR
jgi:putative spermidine/putrescine transport system substrate-binding protein